MYMCLKWHLFICSCCYHFVYFAYEAATRGPGNGAGASELSDPHGCSSG